MAKENKQVDSQLMKVGGVGLVLNTVDDMWRTAKMFATSGLCPKGLDTPEKVIVVLQAGAELGFKPWQSMQSLHVVNGRVGLEGKAMAALIRRSAINESLNITYSGTPYQDDYTVTITSKRVDQPEPNVTDFTVADAKLAKLWGTAKDNWAKYPKDMLTWRCVSRHAHQYYSDVTHGLYTVDELHSIPAEPTEPDNKTVGSAGLRERMKERATEAVRSRTAKPVESREVETIPTEPGSVMSEMEKDIAANKVPDGQQSELERQKAALAASEEIINNSKAEPADEALQDAIDDGQAGQTTKTKNTNPYKTKKKAK